MKIRVSSTEAARNLMDLLSRIQHRRDRFVITKNNRPVAELGPVSGAGGATLGDLWKAMREVMADKDFAADLERVNAADALLQNPWV